jgi:uncharacterized protein (UPF0332 family)
MSEDLDAYLPQAEDALEAAKELENLQFARGAIHLCYYSFFWVIRGLLAAKGIFGKTHSGTHSLFGEHFVKPGTVPKHYGKVLTRLFERRQAADYELADDFTEEEVHEFIHETEAFLAFVKKHFQ